MWYTNNPLVSQGVDGASDHRFAEVAPARESDLEIRIVPLALEPFHVVPRDLRIESLESEEPLVLDPNEDCQVSLQSCISKTFETSDGWSAELLRDCVIL